MRDINNSMNKRQHERHSLIGEGLPIMSLMNNASDGTEEMPIDSRLLSDAIIELNISRRNVSIFPKDLLSGKSILFKGIAEKLREEIYGTLKNYPYEHVSDLIEAGLESKNESIREESLRLHKAKAD